MVDIVIVNWNSGHYLNQCIKSIFENDADNLVSKVIVIDNHSADGSTASILQKNKIELILNKENAGFARACNQGFRLCTAPFILLLNPDTVIHTDTLSQCLSYMQTNSWIDIMGCRLLNEEGQTTPSCSRFPTPLHIFFDASGLSKIAPAFFTPATVMTDWKHAESRYVNQVMGAFMFMGNDIFKKVGYFDERFFVYYEELDFSKRLAELGGKIFYNYNITAVHTGEGTTQSVKGYRLFLNLRSRLLYAKKYFSSAGYLLVWFSTFFIEPFARIFFLLMTLQFVEAKEVIKGFKLLIRNH